MNKNGFIPESSYSSIDRLMSESCTIVQTTIASINSFRQNNNKLRIQKNMTINEKQYALYKLHQYYNFQGGFKSILDPMRQLKKSMRSFEISKFVDKINEEINKVDGLKLKLSELEKPFTLKTTSNYEVSLQNTINYLQDLQKNISIVHRQLINIKNQCTNPNTIKLSQTTQMLPSKKFYSDQKNQTKYQPTIVFYFNKIEQSIKGLQKDSSRFSADNLSFRKSYQLYEQFIQGINGLQEKIQTIIKKTFLFTSSYENTKNSIEQLIFGLESLKKQIKQPSSQKLSFAFPVQNQQYFRKVESHLNSMKKYLVDIKDCLNQIKDQNLIQNKQFEKTQINRIDQKLSSQNSSPAKVSLQRTLIQRRSSEIQTQKRQVNSSNEMVLTDILGFAISTKQLLSKVGANGENSSLNLQSITLPIKDIREIQKDTNNIIKLAQTLLEQEQQISESRRKTLKQYGSSQHKSLLLDDNETRMNESKTNYKKDINLFNIENQRLKSQLAQVQNQLKQMTQDKQNSRSSSPRPSLQTSQQLTRLNKQNQQMAKQIIQLKDQLNLHAKSTSDERNSIEQDFQSIKPKSIAFNENNHNKGSYNTQQTSNYNTQKASKEEDPGFINLSESQSSQEKQLQNKINSLKTQIHESDKLIIQKKNQLKQTVAQIDLLSQKAIQKQLDMRNLLDKISQKDKQLQNLCEKCTQISKQFLTALISLMQSINPQQLMEQAKKTSNQARYLTKHTFSKSSIQINVTQQQLTQAEQKIRTSLTAYNSAFSELKSNNQTTQSNMPFNSLKIPQCFAAFQRYLKNSFNFIQLNLKYTLKKDKKVLANYMNQQEQRQLKTNKLETINKDIQEQQNKLNELKKKSQVQKIHLDSLINTVQIQKKTLQNLQKQYQSKITSMFSQIAQKVQQNSKAIEDKHNQQWLNAKLQQKQSQVLSLNSQIIELNREKTQKQSAHKDQIAVLNQKIQQLQENIISLVEKQEAKLNQINEQKNKLISAYKQLSESKDKIIQLQANITRLEGQWRNRNTQIIEKGQLARQLREVKEKLEQAQRQLTQLKAKSLQQADSIKQLIQNLHAQKNHLDQQKASFLTRFQQASQNLTTQYEQDKKNFQKQTMKKVSLITNNFNGINERLAKERDEQYQKSDYFRKSFVGMNRCLKAIYKANYQYLYKDRGYQQSVNLRLINEIDQDQEKILSEQEILHVTAYALHVVCFLEGTNQNLLKCNRLQMDQVKAKLFQIKQTIEKTTKNPQFHQNLNQIKLSFQGNPQNAFEQVQLAIKKLATKTHSEITELTNKWNTKLSQKVDKLKNSHDIALASKSTQVNRLTIQMEQKNNQIIKLSNSLKQLTLTLQKKRIMLDDSEQTNGQLLKSVQTLTASNLKYQTQTQQLNDFIKRLQISAGQNMTQFNQQKKQLQDKILLLKDQITQKKEQITTLENKISDLNIQLKNAQNKNLSLASHSQQAQLLNIQMKSKDEQLTKMISQNNQIRRQLQNLKQEHQQTRQTLNDERTKTSSGSTKALQLRTQNERIIQEKKDLQRKLQQVKEELIYAKKQLQQKASEYSTKIEQANFQQEQLMAKYNFYKQTIKEIELAVRSKLGTQQEIDHKKIPETIMKFNSNSGTIGCRLITSIIIHGYDSQRSDIIKMIEEFTSKKIKRTDLMGRYPEKKSLIVELPKTTAFIMLFKTASGRVFGSFSQGLKKKTFMFAYWTQRLQAPSRQSTPAKSFIPSSHSTNPTSVDLIQTKYLRYGNEELRINLMDMSSISANSDPMGQNYYHDFPWREIMGENYEDSVPLVEVEVHCVNFEQ